MNSYRDTAKKIELDSINLCNQIIDQIFDDMDKFVDIKQVIARFNANPATFLRLILVDPSFFKLRPLLISLLNKYSVNYYSLLWNYCYTFASAPATVANSIIGELNKCHIWDNLDFDGRLFTAATQRGNLKLTNLDRWLAFNEGLLLNNIDYSNHCHEAVWNLAPYFEDYNATVSLVPTLVGGGKFFHSYFEKDGVVLDFSASAAVLDDSFSTIMDPEIVFSCPAGELDERYKKLKERDKEVPNEMCAVLTLAIDEMNKGGRV